MTDLVDVHVYFMTYLDVPTCTLIVIAKLELFTYPIIVCIKIIVIPCKFIREEFFEVCRILF